MMTYEQALEKIREYLVRTGSPVLKQDEAAIRLHCELLLAKFLPGK